MSIIKRQSDIKIAKERIKILFKEAEKTDNLKLKNRYVELARKIGMKYNVKIPKVLKRKYCKYCYKYLVYGKTAQVRVKNKYILVKCLNCGKIMRFKKE